MTIILTFVAVVTIIVLARLNGLRSFSKMSNFDFALTIATGSILASLIVSADPPWKELLALCTLFLARFAISKTRQAFGWVEDIIDNKPLMLMYEGVVLEKNLPLARVTRSDIRGKLREANAIQLNRVRAVVLEATGDVSVLHGDSLDEELLKGVSWGREQRPDEFSTSSLQSGS